MRMFPVRFAQLCVAAVAALAGLAAPPARGDIIVTYRDVGSDLQFSWSGSLPFTPTSAVVPGTNASIAATNTGTSPQSLYGFDGSYKFQNTNSTRTPSGTGLFAATFSTLSGTQTGDTFGIGFPTNQAGNTTVFLPGGYTANDPISGTLTIPNTSVAATGLSDVSFELNAGGNVIFQAVPEPSTMALCGVAVAGLGFAGARRLRRRVRWWPAAGGRVGRGCVPAGPIPLRQR